MGGAIGYAPGSWTALLRYAKASHFPIDKNAIERLLKIITLGRKNWLFAWSERGGKTAALLFTLIACTKRPRLNTRTYYRSALERLADLTPNELKGLLATASRTRTPAYRPLAHRLQPHAPPRHAGRRFVRVSHRARATPGLGFADWLFLLLGPLVPLQPRRSILRSSFPAAVFREPPPADAAWRDCVTGSRCQRDRKPPRLPVQRNGFRIRSPLRQGLRLSGQPGLGAGQRELGGLPPPNRQRRLNSSPTTSA